MGGGCWGGGRGMTELCPFSDLVNLETTLRTKYNYLSYVHSSVKPVFSKQLSEREKDKYFLRQLLNRGQFVLKIISRFGRIWHMLFVQAQGKMTRLAPPPPPPPPTPDISQRGRREYNFGFVLLSIHPSIDIILSLHFQGILVKLSSYCSHDLKMIILYQGDTQLIFTRVMTL